VDQHIRIAVPNKGRLREPTRELLRNAGLSFESTDRALTIPVRNVDLELLLVRTDDIPEMVADGVADLGVTGYDLLAETAFDIAVTAELGYGRCRLVAAVPNAHPARAVEDLAGLRVATAHPATAERFFTSKGIAVEIVTLSGSVEVAPKLGVADAIVDLVSSGSTLLVNGLRPIVTLLESQAVLVAGRPAEARGNGSVERVTTMLSAVVAGRRKRYVMMNAPRDVVPEIEALIPGLEAPSVLPLAHASAEGLDMVAIHSVVDAGDLWRLLPDLKAAGATGILVLPVDQLIP
jgi:ATP phosphoribosyltransferase